MNSGKLDLAPVEHIAMFFGAAMLAITLIGPFVIAAVDLYFRRDKSNAHHSQPGNWPYFVKTRQGAVAMMILFIAFMGTLGLTAVLIPIALIVQAVRFRL